MPPRKRTKKQATLEEVTDKDDKSDRQNLFEARKRRKTGQSAPTPKPSTVKRTQQQSDDKVPEAPPDWHKKQVHINRAPVLVAWATAVGEQQGYSREEALTFARAISGLMAHSKGKSIGIYDKTEVSEEEKKQRQEEEEEAGVDHFEVFGMKIKGVRQADGSVRAVEHGTVPIDSRKAEGYLKRAFKDDLPTVTQGFKELAEACEPAELGKHAYKLYEEFRPSISSGQAGWGKKGVLDMAKVQSLAQEHNPSGHVKVQEGVEGKDAG